MTQSVFRLNHLTNVRYGPSRSLRRHHVVGHMSSMDALLEFMDLSLETRHIFSCQAAQVTANAQFEIVHRHHIAPALQAETISLRHTTQLPACQIYFIIVLFASHTHLAIHVCLDLPVSGCLGYHEVKVSFHMKIVAVFVLICAICSLLFALWALLLSPSMICPERNLTM